MSSATSLEVLSRKVRAFYANVDPTKSQASMDELVFAAYQNGEEFVNSQLRNKYGMDLNTFASDIGVQPAAAVVVVRQTQPGYYQGVPANGMVINPGTGQGAGVVYMTPSQSYAPGYYNNTSAFSSNQPYNGQNGQQRPPNNDFCLCLTALLACLICFD
jgi:hypothetical protein